VWTASGCGGPSLVAELAGDLVALGDDATPFGEGDGSTVGVADDVGLAAAPAGDQTGQQDGGDVAQGTVVVLAGLDHCEGTLSMSM
jgi:hypothetical protein